MIHCVGLGIPSKKTLTCQSTTKKKKKKTNKQTNKKTKKKKRRRRHTRNNKNNNKKKKGFSDVCFSVICIKLRFLASFTVQMILNFVMKNLVIYELTLFTVFERERFARDEKRFGEEEEQGKKEGRKKKMRKRTSILLLFVFLKL
jgi:hypothetical protein